MTTTSGSSPSRRLRVLITGGNSGVGEATARLFSAEGAAVALLGRSAEKLQRVAAGMSEGAVTIVADVADPAAAAKGVDTALAGLGGLDVVVNAAGIAAAAPLETLDDATWREVIDTNLSGSFYIARAAGLHMKASGGGSIVNVASDLASMGVAGLVHYAAAKAGVVGMTRGLAIELAPLVRVNVVCPGPIDTPMLRTGIEQAGDPAQAMREKRASVPLGRLASPEEVARAIRFLAVEGTFATGTSMAYDGGTSAA